MADNTPVKYDIVAMYKAMEVLESVFDASQVTTLENMIAYAIKNQQDKQMNSRVKSDLDYLGIQDDDFIEVEPNQSDYEDDTIPF
tara:strand:- start:555 stop:809 length:255 start_codon:yes stop_codon:yes gene_type:complete